MLLIRWSALVELHSKLLVNIEWQEARLIGTCTMFSIFTAFYDNNDLKKTCNIDATCQIIFRFYFQRLRIILFIKKVIKYFFLFDYFSYLMCCNFYPSYTLLWLLMIIQICYLIVNYFTQISIEKKHYWNLFCIQNDINQISESYIYQWLYIKSTNMTRKGHCY